MMTLKVIAPTENQINEIANFLMEQRLIAEAIISGPVERLSNASSVQSADRRTSYVLSGLSKSLLFSVINEEMREKYGTDMPLLYAEPLILMDAEHTEEMLATLRKV